MDDEQFDRDLANENSLDGSSGAIVYHHYLLHGDRFVTVGAWFPEREEPPLDPLLKMAIAMDPGFPDNQFVPDSTVRWIYRIVVLDRVNRSYHYVQSAAVPEPHDRELQRATWELAGRACRVRWGFGRNSKADRSEP